MAKAPGPPPFFGGGGPKSAASTIDSASRAAYTRPLVFMSVRIGVALVKRTYQPSKLVRARRHGFRARMATVGGRRVINNRRRQGRKKLSA